MFEQNDFKTLFKIALCLHMYSFGCYDKQPTYVAEITQLDEGITLCVGSAILLNLTTLVDLGDNTLFGPFPIGQYEEITWVSQNSNISQVVETFRETAVVEGMSPGVTEIIAKGPGLEASYEIRVVENAVITLATSHGINISGTSSNDAKDSPQWSPDGSAIVYVRNNQIYKMALLDRQELQLTSTENEKESPQWSPDGSRIVYVADNHLAIVDATGENGTMLTTGPGRPRTPQWSPDGQTILYNRLGRIWTITLQDTAETEIGLGLNPQWSPGGTQIAYNTARGDIEVISSAGGSPNRIVTDEVHSHFNPQWSPDNRFIVYECKHDLFSAGIGKVLATGGNEEVVTFDEGVRCRNPQWSPDGQLLAYSRASLFTSIFVTSLSGEDNQKATCADLYDVSQEVLPTWAPNGSLILYLKGLTEPLIRVVDASELLNVY